MAKIAGDLRLVTTNLDTVTSVSVRASKTRPQGDGLTLGYNAPVPVDNGRVEFDALPGPAVLVLAHGGMATETVPLLVPDVGAVSLADAARAAALADESTLSELEHLAAQAVADVTEVRRLRGEVREDAATATEAAERAAGSATAAGNAATDAEADRVQTGKDRAAAGDSAIAAGNAEGSAGQSATDAGAAAGRSEAAQAKSEAGASTATGAANTASTKAGEAAQSAKNAADSERRAGEIAATGVPDATTAAKGKVRLAGDLAGTADAPTVPGLAGKADKTATDTALAGKADKTATDTALAGKADKTTTDTALAGKIATSEAEAATAITASKLARRTSGKQLQTDVDPATANDLTRKSYVDTQDATVLARVQARPALFSGTGTPPASIPGAVVGDWWLDTTTMQLYKITGV